MPSRYCLAWPGRVLMPDTRLCESCGKTVLSAYNEGVRCPACERSMTGGGDNAVVSVLAERKARGWTMLEMAKRLRDAADDPRDVPDLDAIIHNMYRWESGKGYGISERYRILYCRAFGPTESGLFSDSRPASGTPQGTEAGDGDTCQYVLLALPKDAQLTVVDLTAGMETGESLTVAPQRVSGLRLVAGTEADHGR